MIGSNYNLGLIFEALIRSAPASSSDGHHMHLEITPKDVISIIKGW